MQDKIVFGFIGKPGAGKDTAIGILRSLLQESHPDIPMFQFSDPINECLKILRKNKARPNQQLFSEKNREGFGEDLFNNILYERVQESGSMVSCVGGIRRPMDIIKLRTMDRFRLLFITASPQVRYPRLRARSERPGEAEMTWEQFLEQDNAESERLIDELGRQANYTIDNGSDGVDHLRQAMAAILKAEGLV